MRRSGKMREDQANGRRGDGDGGKKAIAGCTAANDRAETKEGVAVWRACGDRENHGGGDGAGRNPGFLRGRTGGGLIL